MSSRKSIILFFIVLVLSVLFIFTAFIYISGRKEKGTEAVKVDFWLEGPQEIKIGEEKQFIIKIANKDNYSLENIEARLETSPDFLISSSSPEFSQKLEKGYIWFLKELGKGGTKEIIFKAQDYSESGKERLDASLSFNLSGFNPLFEKKFSYSFDLASSVSLDVSLPDQANLGQKIGFKIFLKNLTDKELFNLKVELPANLIFEENESVKKEENKTFWQIEKLLPGEEKEAILEAILKGEIGANDLNFRLGSSYDNKFLSLNELKKQILAQKPDVSLMIKINGGEVGEATTSWGEILPLNIFYQNNSEEDLKNFKVKLDLSDSQPLDLGKTVIFKEKELESLKAKSAGQIDLNLFLKDALSSAQEKIKQGEIDLKVACDYLPGDLGTERVNLAEKEIKIKVKTDVKLTGEARYYTDDYQPIPIGEGPLPLRVGEETKFWLFFRIKNTSNPVKNIVVKTTLSQKVNWLDIKETSVGSVVYDSKTKEIIWQIPHLEAYSGGPYSLVEAKVKVAVTPDEADRNKTLSFTSKVSYLLEDEFTNEKLEGETSQLDSRFADVLINWQGEIK